MDILQQILFYKELGMSLDEIKEIIQNPNFDRINALKEHKIKLLEKRKQIDMLLDNVERTLLSVDGGCKMSDKEKFKGFKKSVIDENEKKYGKEIRSKYGDETIDKSNEKFMKMSEEEALMGLFIQYANGYDYQQEFKEIVKNVYGQY